MFFVKLLQFCVKFVLLPEVLQNWVYQFHFNQIRGSVFVSFSTASKALTNFCLFETGGVALRVGEQSHVIVWTNCHGNHAFCTRLSLVVRGLALKRGSVFM